MNGDHLYAHVALGAAAAAVNGGHGGASVSAYGSSGDSAPQLPGEDGGGSGSGGGGSASALQLHHPEHAELAENRVDINHAQQLAAGAKLADAEKARDDHRDDYRRSTQHALSASKLSGTAQCAVEVRPFSRLARVPSSCASGAERGWRAPVGGVASLSVARGWGRHP